jgi:zinc protease
MPAWKANLGSLTTSPFMKKLHLKSLLSAIACSAVLVSPIASAEYKLEDKIPFSPRLKLGTLPNGLTYYIQKNSLPAKKVELRLVVKAGSILEDDDQQGLAHFTEHMAFNGSTHFKGNELVSFLQSIGIKFGADLNAYTSFDETVYILPVPTDKKGNLDKAFTVLEDWAGGLSFEGAEIDKERGVVLEESRLHKGAGDRMSKLTLPKILSGSRYAERLPIGRDEVLKAFKYDAVKRFYADWYRPDLMAVVVVGDVEPAEAERLVRAHFSKLKNPAHERPRLYATVPQRSASEGLVVTDKETTNNSINILYTRSVDEPETTLGKYRQGLLNNLLNTMLSQRLQELAQTANPPFVGAASGINPLVRGYREFSAYAVIGKAGQNAAIKTLVEENERAAQYGFTATELDRAVKNLLRNLERANSERDKTESSAHAAEMIRNFLVQEPVPGIENELLYAKEFLPAIKPEEITAMVKKLVAGNGNKLVIYQGTGQGDFVPLTNAQVLAAVTGAASNTVNAYQDKAVASALMEQPPAGGKIVAEKVNVALGLTELTLSNGIKVMLKSTDFKNDQVMMSATRDGGKSLFADADFYNGQMAAQLMVGMGVKSFTPTDLGKVLAGKSVSATPVLRDLGEGFSGQSGSADIEAMLQLTYLYFTAPRKDEVLFQSAIGKMGDAVKNLMANPEIAFSDATLKYLYADHPHRPHVPTRADVDNIKLDRMVELYKQRFSSAKGFTFFFVGSFDMDKMKPLVATYLGSLPTADVPTAFKDVEPRVVKGVIKKIEHVGTEQKSNIALVFTGDVTYSSDAQMRLQALVEVLNIKLTERLREELGAVYSPRIIGQMSKNPYGHYAISIGLPCAPENVDKLIKATIEEVQKIRDEGARLADLNKVKENWIKNYREGMKTNTYWVRGLQLALELQQDPERMLSYESRVDALQVAELQGAAKTYFNMDNYLQVVLYPVDKVAQK